MPVEFKKRAALTASTAPPAEVCAIAVSDGGCHTTADRQTVESRPNAIRPIDNGITLLFPKLGPYHLPGPLRLFRGRACQDETDPHGLSARAGALYISLPAIAHDRNIRWWAINQFAAPCLAHFLRKFPLWKNLRPNWNAASRWKSSGDGASSLKKQGMIGDSASINLAASYPCFTTRLAALPRNL